jgi:hypothetical protein
MPVFRVILTTNLQQKITIAPQAGSFFPQGFLMHPDLTPFQLTFFLFFCFICTVFLPHAPKPRLPHDQAHFSLLLYYSTYTPPPLRYTNTATELALTPVGLLADWRN